MANKEFDNVKAYPAHKNYSGKSPYESGANHLDNLVSNENIGNSLGKTKQWLEVLKTEVDKKVTDIKANGTAVDKDNAVNFKQEASNPVSVTGDASTGEIVIKHNTEAGNKHIPSGGSPGQYLKNTGTSGEGTWSSPDSIWPVTPDNTTIPGTKLVDDRFNDNESDIDGLKDITGYDITNVAGIHLDFVQKTWSRLAGAKDITKVRGESDTDIIGPAFTTAFPLLYGLIRRCTINDEGTVTSYYGDTNYTEDGSMGQIMNQIPKIYYRCNPITLEKQTDTSSAQGYHMRVVDYFVTNQPIAGFKLHPAFIDKNGNERDYIYTSAYEGSLYDTVNGKFIDEDATGYDSISETDLQKAKMCSLPNKKPISGYSSSNKYYRRTSEVVAKNRGSGWHSETIQIMSLIQMLILIEYGPNVQATLGYGYATGTDPEPKHNESKRTGQTSEYGNTSWGTTSVQTNSVSWRGHENPYGNIWKFGMGMNIFGVYNTDTQMAANTKGGIPYICNSYDYTEDTTSGYSSAGFTITNANGFITALGYGNPEYDWLFIASETNGTEANALITDYNYITSNLNGYRIALRGGGWNSGSNAGLFDWNLDYASGSSCRNIGSRLCFFKDKTDDLERRLEAIENVTNEMAVTSTSVAGVEVDYENNSITPLAGAVGKTPGSDFNVFPVYGSIRRCTMSEDGTVTSYYGDANFAEDGTMGDVMVEIPKTYYKVTPTKLSGKEIRKCQYYVSHKPLFGFKLHPAFSREDGSERDYVYLSAYEGVLFDASINAYTDVGEQASISNYYDFDNDKMASIVGKIPCSGRSGGTLTRANAEKLANNKGDGWYTESVQIASLIQLLMTIEYGCKTSAKGANSQENFALGVTSKTDSPYTENNSNQTGATSSSGNASYTSTSGTASISWRGIENPYGNIWKFISKINILSYHIFITLGDSIDNTTDGYEEVGFTVPTTSGWFYYFGYDEKFDWLFIPTGSVASTSKATDSIGDYFYINSGNRIALLGSLWNGGSRAGLFCWDLDYASGISSRAFGSRLCYLP